MAKLGSNTHFGTANTPVVLVLKFLRMPLFGLLWREPLPRRQAALKTISHGQTWLQHSLGHWQHVGSLKAVDLCLEMSSNFKHNFCFVVEEIFELGNTLKSQCLGVRVEAQANAINKRPTRDHQCSDWQRTLPDHEAFTNL